MRSIVLMISLVLAALGCGSNKQPQSPAVNETQRPADLTTSEVRSYHGYLERFTSPCGGNDTIATCLQNPGPCKACALAAKFVAHSIRAGFVAAEIEARYLARFDQSRVQAIDLRHTPILGPEDAAVTIVEFADFQCPYCGASVPLLDGLVENYAPHVRVAFKHFPIKHHPFAESSARAAVAAQKQDKFWELHHIMFGNADRLDRTDIETYARSLNLDMDRFSADWDSPQIAALVKADYNQGDDLGVRATPWIFINGRHFDFDLFHFGGEDLLSWIELEIHSTTGKPYNK